MENLYKIIQYLFRLFISLINLLVSFFVRQEGINIAEFFALLIVIDICSWFVMPRFPSFIELIVILIYMAIIDGMKHNNTTIKIDNKEAEIKSYIDNLAWVHPDLDEATLRSALREYGAVPDKYIAYWQSCYKPTHTLTEKKTPPKNPYEQMQTTPKVFENNWCLVTYDGYTKSITCKDKKIVDGVQKKFITIENYGTNPVTIWLTIAKYFNEQTNYSQLRNILMGLTSIVESKVEADPIQIKEKFTTHFRLIDVNSASEDELIALPGINKIQAKKIIQFRERERYFNSREDFFETMKIKDHFQKQMKHIVVANIVMKKQNSGHIQHQERKVDL